MPTVNFERLYAGVDIDDMSRQLRHKNFQHRRGFVRKGIQQPAGLGGFLPNKTQLFKPIGNGMDRVAAKKAKGLGHECAIPIAANI